MARKPVDPSATQAVVYRGSQEHLQGTKWSVPLTVLNTGKAAAWIESQAREAAAKAAAAAEAEQRDQQVLADRQQQIRAAEEADSLRAELAAMQERLATLERGGSIDYQQLSSTSASLAASLASGASVAERTRAVGKKAAATADALQARLDRAEHLLAELQNERQQFTEGLRTMSNLHYEALARERQQLLDEVRQHFGSNGASP